MLDTPLMLVELSLMERRYQAVRAVIHDGVSVAEVARSGIYRLLKRHNLFDPNARKLRSRKFKRWERGVAMEFWQMDVVGGILLA